MDINELFEQLTAKMQKEQDEYRAWLLSLPKEEILQRCYEYSTREDILVALDDAHLKEEELQALLDCSYPLSAVYKEYTSWDTNYMQDVTDSIQILGERYAKEASEKEREEAR